MRGLDRRGSVLLEALVALFVLGVGAAAAFTLLQRSLETLRTAELRGPAAPLVLEVVRGGAAADSLARDGLVLWWEPRGDSLRVEVGRPGSDGSGTGGGGAGSLPVFVVPAREGAW